MNARVTLISHAATDAVRRAAFPLDEPLEEREFTRIADLGWHAPRAQRILSGPEQRTQQTAEALGLMSTVVNDLRDCDYAQWRGRDLNEIQSSDPEGLLAWLTDPAAAPHGGESIVDLIARTASWLEDQKDLPHTIAITHPSLIRAAIVHLLGAPAASFWRIDIAPLSLTDLRFNGRSWTLRSAASPLSASPLADAQPD